MNKTLIDYRKLNAFPALTLDYLEGKKELDGFYKYAPTIESFKQAILDRNTFPINREILVEVLLEQNKECNAAAINNIQSLKQKNTFTVTTGHQLNVFTGPLYFIFKIVTIINLTKELKAVYPENDFVPVYWMASEDHDIEEINNVSVFGMKFVWETDQKGAAGRLDTTSLQILLQELYSIIGDSENGNTIRELLNVAYGQERTLAEATRVFVNGLFGKYGLVILDADNQRFKNEFFELMRDEIICQNNFKIINDTISKLKNDYKIQVNPREINLFYMQDGFRERIVNASENRFEVLNTNLSFAMDE
ncbi:MAG: bacillithiol biosynthesis BshC, partial [Bacteroidota bacterium]